MAALGDSLSACSKLSSSNVLTSCGHGRSKDDIVKGKARRGHYAIVHVDAFMGVSEKSAGAASQRAPSPHTSS